MAVRDALLAILLIGPAYGFQLHNELAARTGRRRTVNVGQTYGTLDRLSERGLIRSAGSTEDGLPLYGLTNLGGDEALAWLRGRNAQTGDPWDESIDRVLVGASLPGFDLPSVLAAERATWSSRLVAMTPAVETSLDATQPPTGRDLVERYADRIEAARASALIEWLDAIKASPPEPFGFTTDRPRRGRRPGVRTELAPSEPTRSGAQSASA